MIHEVERKIKAEPATAERPLRWRWFVRGKPDLCGLSSEPLLDACRALKRTGAQTADECRLFREGSNTWDLRCSVGWGADHTVEDSPRAGPRFVKYKPFPARGLAEG